MIKETTFEGSSQIGEILLFGVEEIIGRPGLNAVINLTELPQKENARIVSFPGRMSYANVTATTSSLETMFGPRGGRGIALRAGRAGFKYLLRQYGASIGITDLNFRMLPVPLRLKTGLEAMATLMGRIGDEKVIVSDEPAVWQWESEQCPFCWQRQTEEPACQFTVGLLQEFFAWASSGRMYSVREVACRASGGDACLIQIDKRALD